MPLHLNQHRAALHLRVSGEAVHTNGSLPQHGLWQPRAVICYIHDYAGSRIINNTRKRQCVVGRTYKYRYAPVQQDRGCGIKLALCSSGRSLLDLSGGAVNAWNSSCPSHVLLARVKRR